jgi:hypothetical protein
MNRVIGLGRTSKQNWVHERYFLLPLPDPDTGEMQIEPFLLAANPDFIPGDHPTKSCKYWITNICNLHILHFLLLLINTVW